MRSEEKLSQITGSRHDNRIIALDLARGWAMVFVVIIHVLEQLSSKEVKESLFAGILNMGTSMWAATMFMFLMGVGLSLSRRGTLASEVFRGVKLLALAYLLNFLRGTVPTWAGLLTHQFTLEDLKPYSPLYVTVELDILHFAGLALIICAPIKHFVKKWYGWLIIAIVIVLACPVVFGRRGFSPVITYFMNFLWRTKEYGHFPIFPWLVYPLSGMIFGHFLKHFKNPRQFFPRSTTLGFLLCIIGGYMSYNYSDFNMESWLSGEYNEGQIHPWMVVCELGVLLVSLSFHQFCATRIPWNKWFGWLTLWSKDVTLLYCLQWIIIGWMVIYINNLGFAGSIASMVFVFMVTELLGKGWKRMVSGGKTARS